MTNFKVSYRTKDADGEYSGSAVISIEVPVGSNSDESNDLLREAIKNEIESNLAGCELVSIESFSETENE